jgi:hypothetical protein
MSKASPAEDLIKAAHDYGEALRRQHVASEDLHQAAVAGNPIKGLDRAHDKACDAVGVAQHEVLIAAAIVGGWTREDAEGSV